VSRTERLMLRARGDALPTRLVCVDVESALCDVNEQGTVQREDLTSWSAAGWSREPGRPARDWERSGETAKELWEAVDWTLRRGGICWCVSIGASRTWGLLGLWGLLESGYVRLHGVGPPGGPADQGATVRLPRGESTSTGGGAAPAPAGDGVPGVPVHPATSGRAGRGRKGRGGPDPGFACLEDPPTIVTVHRPGIPGRITICDIRNWGIRMDESVSGAPARARWLRDVMRRMTDALRTNGMGMLKPTSGSQALYSFRRRWLNSSIMIHTNARALDIEGAAYFGGRCEARRIGSIPGRVYHVDFRALYPWLLAQSKLPVLLHSTGVGIPHHEANVEAVGADVIAEVTLRAAEPAYPQRHDGHTRYPVGVVRTTLAGPELGDAVAHGRVLAWHRWARYHMEPCFAGFARDLLAWQGLWRDAGDAPMVQWAKALLVCLPGKMGQKGGSWRPYRWPPWHIPWSTWLEKRGPGPAILCRDLGGQCEWESQEPWGRDSVPAIAAWITSAGRMALLRAIRAAGWDQTYYHDTDSLLVGVRGFNRLVRADLWRESEPGYLRIVSRSDRCTVWGPKYYQCGKEVVCAGRPKGQHAKGPKTGTYWYYQDLKSGTASGAVPIVRRVLRKYARDAVYAEGRVDAEGWVRPEVSHD
jgi:hypothetical protein